jgi:aspartyl-tRNA(Asn)/glutamyl-tRNA(Gln) amidotransferase subunit A
MPTNSTELSAVAMAKAFAARSLSPVEALEASLARLDAVNADLNAFCLVDAELGRSMAKASEARWSRGEPLGPLDGVPVAIKDTGHVAGWPTRFGSKVSPTEASTQDTPGIARLREAGAVFFCKTTTPEFGWKGLTDGPLTGITRNPWDRNKTPGGSSGGAAVAVATGVAPIATGGDGGGSIRIPAAFTGTYGLKPTFGLVPNFVQPLGELGVFGGLSHTVEDSAVLLRLLIQPDPRDFTSIPYKDMDYPGEMAKGVAGLRIAHSRNLGCAFVDPEVDAAVTAGVELLSAAGAHVEEVSLDLSGARAAMDIIWRSGFAATLKQVSGEQLRNLEPDLLDLILSARDLTAADLQWALDERRALAKGMQLFHQQYDLLITPTMPIPAFEAGLNTPDKALYPSWLDWTPMTWPFNLTTQPAASVPCGLTRSGLPIGLQIVASRFREDLILRASGIVEAGMPMPALPVYLS